MGVATVLHSHAVRAEKPAPIPRHFWQTFAACSGERIAQLKLHGLSTAKQSLDPQDLRIARLTGLNNRIVTNLSASDISNLTMHGYIRAKLFLPRRCSRLKHSNLSDVKLFANRDISCHYHHSRTILSNREILLNKIKYDTNRKYSED